MNIREYQINYRLNSAISAVKAGRFFEIKIQVPVRAKVHENQLEQRVITQAKKVLLEKPCNNGTQIYITGFRLLSIDGISV